MKTIVFLAVVITVLISLPTIADDEEEPFIYDPGVIPKELPPIKPINPIGTTDCQQTYVCTGSGDCKWITICR